jgi:hypothetical protein
MDEVWGKGGHNRGHACMHACVVGIRDMRKQKGVERSLGRQSGSMFVRGAKGSERVAMPGAAKKGKGVCGPGGRENERLKPTVRIYDESRGSVRGSVTSTLIGLLHAMSMWTPTRMGPTFLHPIVLCRMRRANRDPSTAAEKLGLWRWRPGCSDQWVILVMLLNGGEWDLKWPGTRCIQLLLF